MWMTFYACMAVAVAVMLIPGFFVARGLRADAPVSLMISPLMSLSLYNVMALVYERIGIACSWATLALPVAAFGIILCGIGRLASWEPLPCLSISDMLSEKRTFHGLTTSTITVSLIVALLTGIGVSYFVFVNSLPTPDAFVQNYDNGWHLARIALFMKTGNYSTLVGGFYPSGWHALAAMAGSVTGANAPIAENAVNTALTAFVYPLASVMLLSTLFSDSKRRTLIGSFFFMSIAYFPWRIMLYGPMFPNMASFVVMPLETALFIRLFRSTETRRDRIVTGIAFVLGGMCLGFLHPNSIFSCGVFLIPFCLNECRLRVSAKHGLKKALLAEFLLLLAFVGLWIALDFAPFMQSTVWYRDTEPMPFIVGIKWAMALNFVIRRLHFLIGSFVILGCIVMLFDNERRWLTPAYLMTAALYVVAFGVDAPWRNLIAGFWYSDLWRLAAATSVYAVPLIAVGADATLKGLTYPLRLIARRAAQKDNKGRAHLASRIAVAIQLILIPLMLIYNYYPFKFIPWQYRVYAFDTVRHNFTTTYDVKKYEWAALTSDEMEFLEKVAKTVPAGERVLNQPYDGSVFAYPMYDIDVVFISYNMGFTDQTLMLRDNIATVATNTDIQQLAKELGVHYVLQLDQGDGKLGMSEDASFIDLGYHMEEWASINAIRDDTPGFSVVLSEGDMRLYHIDAID